MQTSSTSFTYFFSVTLRHPHSGKGKYDGQDGDADDAQVGAAVVVVVAEADAASGGERKATAATAEKGPPQDLGEGWQKQEAAAQGQKLDFS